MCVLVTPGNANALILNDGQVHTISTSLVELQVFDGPGGVPTTVNIVSGAIILQSVLVHDSSKVEMFDGQLLQGFEAFDSSVLRLHGGSIKSGVTVWGSSFLDLAGGLIETSMVQVRDDGYVRLRGAAIGGTVEVLHNAGFEMNSGAVGNTVSATNNAIVHIRGGEIGGSNSISANQSASVVIFGGSLLGGQIRGEDLSRVIIFGHNFAVDTIPVGFGLIQGISGQLTGALSDGTSLDVPFLQSTGPVITLHNDAPPPPVPALSGGAKLALSLVLAVIGWIGVSRIEAPRFCPT